MADWFARAAKLPSHSPTPTAVTLYGYRLGAFEGHGGGHLAVGIELVQKQPGLLPDTGDNVRAHSTGKKSIHHPVVGDLDLTYEGMNQSPQGLQMLVFSAEPGTSSHDGLQLLSNWAAAADSPRSPPASQ